MKNIKFSLTIKLLVFSLMSFVALWSYAPGVSIDTISNAVANSTNLINDTRGAQKYLAKTHIEDNGNIQTQYIEISSLNQYQYFVTDIANPHAPTTADWWFIFTTSIGTKAYLAMDFTPMPTIKSGESIDIPIYIKYKGVSISGTLKGMTFDEPSNGTIFEFTLIDGVTGTLTYNASEKEQFTMKINHGADQDH